MKTIYTVTGYTHSDFKDTPTIFRAYTTRNKAFIEALKLAEEALESWKQRYRDEGIATPETEEAELVTHYGFGRLESITDDTFHHIYIRIIPTALRTSNE